MTTGTAPRGDRAGAVKAGGKAGDDRGRRRRKGLLWLLLGLALLLVLAVVLLSLIGNSGEGGGQARGGDLAVAGQPLLPLKGDPKAMVGRKASGQGVVVQAVNPNEGFWVGSSARDRLYVEYGGDVGETEAYFAPKVGQRVGLTGPVRAAPRDPGKLLRLKRSDAQQVERQGAYINADRVAAQ